MQAITFDSLVTRLSAHSPSYLVVPEFRHDQTNEIIAQK
jgi:hypothetical protein